MMVTKPKDEQHTAAQRKGHAQPEGDYRLIIDVAERLFSQFGFEVTTVADIAREVRMTPERVLRFFSDKSEIKAAIIDRARMEALSGAHSYSTDRRAITPGEWQRVALWDEAVESLGRSARVLEELAESTGEAIARIAAQGDRIDRIQNETRALLKALVAPGVNA